MNKEIFIGEKRIAADAPAFIVAEMSANHLQDYDRAVRILHAAKEAGADAVKLQTYTADTRSSAFPAAPSGTEPPCTGSTRRRPCPGNGTPL